MKINRFVVAVSILGMIIAFVLFIADCKIPKKIIRKRVNDNQENKILKKESHPHKKDITKENDENRFKKGNILLMCAMKSTCEHS